MNELIERRIKETIEVKQAILDDAGLLQIINIAAECMINILKNGGKLIVCGNGGSASDAMHFVGELVGRFQRERSAWPALALNSNPVVMSSIANDYDYSEIFSRQVYAFAHENDLLLGISTSGNSENVLKAIEAAKYKGIHTIGLLGCGGGRIADVADLSMVVPSGVTARVQESHIVIIHILCELIENALFST